jgi:hypothetical protein
MVNYLSDKSTNLSNVKLLQRSILIVAALAFFFADYASAQQKKASIRFIEKEFNFGTFRESAGIVTHEFIFVNEGEGPAIINNVSSNCGCTVTQWTSDPVPPGGSGSVTVNYNPEDRPGTFSRPVTVQSNSVTPSVTLLVKGVVIPVDLVGEVFRYRIGDLLLSGIYASFGELYKGDTAKQILKVYNSSETDSLAVSFQGLPRYIKVNTFPRLIEPGGEGSIEIFYNTNWINDWDYIVDRLQVNINEKETGESINVTSNLREDFSKLTAEDLKNAPEAVFDTTVFNFGVIFEDAVPVIHDFILTNSGKEDLIIRKVSASCGCTAVIPEVTAIKPGESAGIKAVFNPAGQGGSQKKAMTVITNDPRHSKYILWIEGDVMSHQGTDGE